MSRWMVVVAVLVLLGLAGWWLGQRRAPKPAPTGESTVEPAVEPAPAASPVRQIAAVGPVRQIAAAPPAASRVAVRASWGTGPGQLGHRRDPETQAEGPMSLAVGAGGEVWVLDQINRRVQRWSKTGAPLAPIPIAGDSAQDLALGARGVALLDRLGEKNVRLFSTDGSALGELPLGALGIDDPGGTTGLFTDASGKTWVEVEHGRLVRADGAAPPGTIPGRPMRTGPLYLSGAIADRAAGTATVRALDAAGEPAWQTTVALGAPILYLVLLDSDAAGNVYVGGYVGHESATPPFRVVDETVVIAGLAPNGVERGALTLPAAPSEDETFREFTVGDDGTIYRMLRSEAGVTIEAYRL